MDKIEHGKRLAAAMASRRMGRETVADATGVDVRTVTNWTSGHTMPSQSTRVDLRILLGDYDTPGDPVEVAVRGSSLVEWRRDAVLSFYKRNLHEQAAEDSAAGASA